MGICNTNALADKPKNDSDDKYETRFSFDGFEDNENGSGSSIEKSTQENTHNVLENTTPIAITNDFFTSPTTATTATTTTATTTTTITTTTTSTTTTTATITTTNTTATLTTITEKTGLMGNNCSFCDCYLYYFKWSNYCKSPGM